MPTFPWRCPWVLRNEKWFCINRQGELRFAAGFNRISDYSEGLAAVARKDDSGLHWGYLDRDGVMVIDTTLDFPGYFRGGLALVHRGANGKVLLDDPEIQHGGSWQYINARGQVVWKIAGLWIREREVPKGSSVLGVVQSLHQWASPFDDQIRQIPF